MLMFLNVTSPTLKEKVIPARFALFELSGQLAENHTNPVCPILNEAWHLQTNN